jgi:hypothetical protein
MAARCAQRWFADAATAGPSSCSATALRPAACGVGQQRGKASSAPSSSSPAVASAAVAGLRGGLRSLLLPLLLRRQ